MARGDSGDVRPEYPRPAFRRESWVNLNGEWEFGSGAKPTFDRRILVPFCAESELSGIGDLPGDTVWYRRSFDAPDAECLLLHFGAVDYRATVWVNDVEVGRHMGGHTPFGIDITGVARARDNLLVIRAEDPLADKTVPRGKQYWKAEPEGIFYTPTTGIWQTVWLEPVPSRRIRGLRVDARLEDGSVEVHLDADGEVEVVARLDGVVVGRSTGDSTTRARIELEEVVAWHPDTPRLYDLECTVDGDRVDTYFGLRTVETRDAKVWLNGEPFVERLVLDQGYWPDGLLTAPTDEALRRDIELAKSFGFNGARKHQKVEDPRWLYWADRLGFLVWGEMPSFHEHSEQAERRLAAEWTQAVERDRGHPSIVTWVVANESFGLGDVDPAVRSSFLVRLYEITRELDATRPVVSNDGWQHARSDLCTIHDYSPPEVLTRRYGDLGTAFDGAEGHRVFDPGFAYSGQPILVTEFGGLRVAGGGGWGWLEVTDTDQLLRDYGRLVDAFMQPGPVEGFCYTQLTDVQQEQNGLLTSDRRPKADPNQIRAATLTSKNRY